MPKCARGVMPVMPCLWQVTLANGGLRLSGETKSARREARISRAMRLPEDADAESEEVSVTHENGLINIFVPKKPGSEPRALKIEATEGGKAKELPTSA